MSWSGNGESQTGNAPQDSWPVAVSEVLQLSKYRAALQTEGHRVDLSRKHLTTPSWILYREGVGGTTMGRPGGLFALVAVSWCVKCGSVNKEHSDPSQSKEAAGWRITFRWFYVSFCDY